MEKRTNFLEALNQCQDPDIACKLTRIRAYGSRGIREALRSGRMQPNYLGPGPSLKDIELWLKPIIELINRVLPPQIKFSARAFRLLYDPHFQVLEMFEKSMDRTWTSIEFLLWSMDILDRLTDRTNQYVKKTGQFNFSQYVNYFNGLKDDEYSIALKNVRIVAGTLTAFDYDLLCDYRELIKTLNKGMEQITKIKAPINIPEQIGFKRVLNDGMLVSFAINPKLFNATDALRKHYDSWRLVDKKCPPFASLEKETRELIGNIDLVISMYE